MKYLLKIKDLELPVSFIDTDGSVEVYLESMSEDNFWEFIELFDIPEGVEVKNFQFTRWNVAGELNNELNSFKLTNVETERGSSFFENEKDIETIKSVAAKLYKVTYTQITDLNLI
jgi:hypothetical protein